MHKYFGCSALKRENVTENESFEVNADTIKGYGLHFVVQDRGW
jgi:hypothetical protein